MKRIHFVHVTFGARVVTRHPAAQPGGLERPSESAAVAHLNLRWPEGLGPKAAAFSLPGVGASPVGEQGVAMNCVRSISVAIAALAMSACLATPLAAAPAAKDVLKIYADIAEAAYTDSADTARTLKLAVDALLANPTKDNLLAATAAWTAGRLPSKHPE